jgi:hypothetical protein
MPVSRRTHSLLRLLPLGLLLAVGCSNKLDQAAKARVFSPEEPTPDIQRAGESLQVADAATDGAVWDRLWRMDRLEVTHRIGSHRAHGTAHFKWTLGDHVVDLGEDQLFETDTAGYFHATETNTQDSGLEFIWTEGKAYARNRYGPFHERRTDRAQQDTVREQATSALRTVFELCGRRLHGSPAGPGHFNGRAGTRFTLSLGPAWGPLDDSLVPPPVFGQARTGPHDPLKAGPDPDTAHRLAFDSHEEPVRVSGEILVDDSGVIVKANLKSRFQMFEKGAAAPALLDLEVTYELEPKAGVKIAAPKDVVSLKLPHVVNDPLWFTRTNGATAVHDEEEEREKKIEEGRTEEEAPGSTRSQKQVPPPAKLPPPRRTADQPAKP